MVSHTLPTRALLLILTSSVLDNEPANMVKRESGGADALDNDNQKTHYWINPKKKRKGNFVGSLMNKFESAEVRRTPLFKHFNGKEANNDVEKRYLKLNEVLEKHMDRIGRILDEANTELFEKVLSYVKAPFNEESESKVQSMTIHKMPLAFLVLGSNMANNERVVKDLKCYVREREERGTTLVTLDWKNCDNIKSTLREVIKQIMIQKSLEGVQFDRDEESSSSEAEEDDSDNENEYDGNINYDFDTVENWYTRQFSRDREELRSNCRVVILVQDSDSISNQVLNQLIKLIYSYSSTLPIKVIMCLSSDNVSEWVNNNLSNELKLLVKMTKFHGSDTRLLGYKLIDEIFLRNKKDDRCLLANYNLFSIVLKRFQNSCNSIDSLINQIKLCFMIYFYQLPLSNLLDEDFEISSNHIQCLRKLPSFKQYIEHLIFEYNSLKKQLKQQESFEDFNQGIGNAIDPKALKSLKREIVDLLNNDQKTKAVFNQWRQNFKRYKVLLFNLTLIIYHFQPLDFNYKKSKFEIHQMIITDNIRKSLFLRELLTSLTRNETRIDHFLKEKLTSLQLNVDEDSYVSDLLETKHLETKGVKELLLTYINNVHKCVEPKLEKNLFYEVFTLDGGEFVNLGVSLEENYENLMLNLLRPKLRTTLESGLEDPDSYLRNELINTDSKRVQPLICQLFRVYKDAPVLINIYDFYTAFAASLDNDVLDEIIRYNPDKSLNAQLNECKRGDKQIWNKLTYSWFLQACHELINIGILKEKSKNDYLEKAIWINI